MFVDSHVHLNSPEFDADLEAVLERARAAGVERFLCPGYDLESSRRAVGLAARYAGVAAAVGVHPHDARRYDAATEAEFEAELAAGRAAAAGEMGLDYYYDNSPRDTQRDVLCRQLRLAQRHRVPAVVHNRDSDDDMAAILDSEAPGLRLVLHAFTGSRRLIEVAQKHGFYFGIGGFVTFKNHPLAGVLHELPRTALLLETDAPFLSPHPLRGRRNEPARVEVVARKLADMLGLEVAQVAELTSDNYERFLDRPNNRC